MTATSLAQPGAAAPDFEATTWEGRPVRLSDQRGQPVWLAFFRYAACPLCNLRVHEMIQRQAQWESQGLRILAVFQSPAKRMARYVGRQKPPFPLIADPKEALYRLYGVGSSRMAMIKPGVAPKLASALAHGFMPGMTDGTVTRVPSDCLIDANGMIADRFDGLDIADHIPFERVEKFLNPQ